MQDTLKKDIIIIGGGGHAKVLIGAIRSSSEFNIKGILDPKLPINSVICGVPVIGTDELLLDRTLHGACIAIAVGSMRAGDQRKKLYERYKEMQYVFPVIKHSSTVVADGVTIGDGVQIMAGVVIQPEASIGSNCIINTSAVIEHDCRIADHVHIAPGAILGGGVSVGENSLVGLGAGVLSGVKIGKNVTVGAGSVIINDVKDGCTVVGVPARGIKL